jgi:hypothetical protein
VRDEERWENRDERGKLKGKKGKRRQFALQCEIPHATMKVLWIHDTGYEDGIFLLLTTFGNGAGRTGRGQRTKAIE